MSLLPLILVLSALVPPLCKTAIVAISLRGVPPKHRAEVLHGAAAFFRPVRASRLAS